MATLSGTIRQYLDMNDLKFDFQKTDTHDLFTFSLQMRDINACRVLIGVYEGSMYITYTKLPLNVPESRRQAVGEFLHRANYGMKYGCFEMDFEDGEVRFKVPCRTDENIPDVKSVGFHIEVGLYMMDRYAKGILAVLYGSSSPSEACVACEG